MTFPKYESYKDSGVEWLGKIPEGWALKKLKFLARIKNGQDYKAVAVDEPRYPVIGSGGKFAYASTYLFNGESVLLGRKGTIDKPLYVNEAFWTVDTMFYTKIYKNTYPKFFYYCVLTIPFGLYSTNTAIPSMTQEDLGNHTFSIPDLEEQKRIVEFLDRKTAEIDEAIAHKQRLIELLQEQKIILINQTLTNGSYDKLQIEEKQQLPWLFPLPEGWKREKLKFNSSLKGRLGWQNLRSDEYTDEGPFLVSSEHFCDGEIDWHRCNHVRQDRYEMAPEIILKEEDVLFMKDGASMGKLAYVEKLPGDACLNSHILLMRPLKNSYLPRFLFYVLQSGAFESYMCQKRKGATFFGFSQQAMGNYLISLPPIETQIKMVNYLDSELSKMRENTEQIKESINTLKELQSVLISQAVTGKIKV